MMARRGADAARGEEGTEGRAGGGSEAAREMSEQGANES